MVRGKLARMLVRSRRIPPLVYGVDVSWTRDMGWIAVGGKAMWIGACRWRSRRRGLEVRGVVDSRLV